MASTSHFGFNFTPISSQYPAITPGTYVVQAGDSLQGIAQAIYGDASLWYLIADANPIFQNSTLTAGTVLQLPNTVIASKNNSTTFKPFSAQDLIGDVTPPLPPPPAAKSNVFASLIIVAVAVVASVVTYGALAPATTSGAFAAGAAAGAASSASSQVAGIALGVQNNFSFGAVARGALVGGLSAGLTQAIGGSAAGSVKIDGRDVDTYFGLTGRAAQAAQAAVSSTIGQSVNIALGYQNNFSFAAVAASAVAAGLVTSPEGQGSNGRENPGTSENSFSQFANDFGRNLARNGIRNSVQIALEGGGKISIANIAGDAFGNALGNALVREIRSGSTNTAQQANEGRAGSVSYNGPLPGAQIVAEIDAIGDQVNQAGEALASIGAESAVVGAGAPSFRTTTVQRGDSISTPLGTSNPRAIQRFNSLNGTGGSNADIFTGQSYEVASVGNVAIDASESDFFVSKGQFTFDSEGTDIEGSRTFSRVISQPTPLSGVTIGRGYDLKETTFDQARSDFLAAGIPDDQASSFAAAAGLSGNEAKQFVSDHVQDFDPITPTQQKVLFENSYAKKEREFIDVYNRQTKTFVDAPSFSDLDPRIQEVAIDTAYQGVPKPLQASFFYAVASNYADQLVAFYSTSLAVRTYTAQRVQTRIKLLIGE